MVLRYFGGLGAVAGQYLRHVAATKSTRAGSFGPLLAWADLPSLGVEYTFL
jgi:hypothetical protein